MILLTQAEQIRIEIKKESVSIMGVLTFLLVILELAIIVGSHLIIPIIVVKRRLTYQDKTLWLIALAGGLLGYVVMALLAQMVTLQGVYLSAMFTLIGYLILDKHCSSKITVVLYFTDLDIKEKLRERREQGELSTPYIKRLIREDMKRE